MEVNSKSLNVGILGKGGYTSEIIQRFVGKGRFGMCCGFNTHEHEDIIKLRSFDELEHASDCVLIFDPAYSDFEVISGILRLSKHVYLQYDGLLSSSEIRKLSELAKEAGCIFQFGLKHRYLDLNIELFKLGLKPRIIESSRYSVYNEKSTHLSVIEDLMVPDIDMAITMANSRLKSVYATGVGVLYNDPDVVNARLEFYNGCIANFSASKIAQKEVHKIRFFQNSSFYDANYLSNKLRILKGEESNVIDEGSDKTFEYQKLVNPMEILEKELDSFYYCITIGADSHSGAQEVLNIRDVTDRIFDQLERNFKVK